MIKDNRQQKGFTLIEIVSVIVIIGTLASLALVNFRRTMEIRQCRQARFDMRALSVRLVQCFVKNHSALNTPSVNEAITFFGQLNTLNPPWVYAAIPGQDGNGIIAILISAQRSNPNCTLNGSVNLFGVVKNPDSTNCGVYSNVCF